MALDENKLHDFLGRALVDLGGAINAVLMSIGDALGLYKALAAGPQSSAELADNTNTNERYIREWLNSQAAGGYVLYDKATGKYSLSEEQELCLANSDGPVDLPGASLLVQDFFHVRERALENFRTGKGMEWGEHHPCLFHETSGFSVPAIMQIFFHRGFRRSTGWKVKFRNGQKPLTSVAVTAQALFCSPRHSPSLNSSDTTITVRLSRRRRNARKTPASSMLGSRLRTLPAIGRRNSI